MKHFLSPLVVAGIIGLIALFGWAHAATPPITLGTILFPPGQVNEQLYQIDLDSFANTVTGIPQVSGSPEMFPYHGYNGKGLKQLGGLLIGVETNEVTPGVTFRQYVQTGDVYLPSEIKESNNCTIEGEIEIDGIEAEVCIDESTSPGGVTIEIKTSTFGQSYYSPNYPQSNYAPFVIGDNLYAVEPHAPTPDTFRVVKWWQWHDKFTNGVYVAP